MLITSHALRNWQYRLITAGAVATLACASAACRDDAANLDSCASAQERSIGDESADAGADVSSEGSRVCERVSREALCFTTKAEGTSFDTVCSRLAAEFGADCRAIDPDGPYGACSGETRLTWAMNQYFWNTRGQTCLGTRRALDNGAVPSRHYELRTKFEGAQFFDGFDFYSGEDPTHGAVQYVTREQAAESKLVRVDGATGRAIVEVDAVSPAGSRRRAVRLESKLRFTTGLVVLDVHHVPDGNGVWPAFWSFGDAPNPWPNQGEIDIVEGVNGQAFNQATLHTSTGCQMKAVNEPAAMTSRYVNRDCNAGSGFLGCGTELPSGTFGKALNERDGGIYAMEWTESQIALWFWPRGAAPADAQAGGEPRPETWGKPSAYFALGGDCPASHFTQHKLVLNTTLCGDWAGNTYNGADGAKGLAACEAFVTQNPRALANAYWDVSSIRLFQRAP